MERMINKQVFYDPFFKSSDTLLKKERNFIYSFKNFFVINFQLFSTNVW